MIAVDLDSGRRVGFRIRPLREIVMIRGTLDAVLAVAFPWQSSCRLEQIGNLFRGRGGGVYLLSMVEDATRYETSRTCVCISTISR